MVNNRRAAVMLFFLSVLMTGSICRCTTGEITGGGTEDVNTRVVAGTVMNPDGTPAPQAQVLVLSAGHDPVRDSGEGLSIDTTDDNGAYLVSVPATGVYSAQIVALAARTRAAISREAVTDDTTFFPSAVLSQPGAVKVQLPADIDTATGYLYIPGTTVFAYANSSSGFITLDSVPAGSAAEIVFSETEMADATVLRYDVPVRPDETTTVWNPAWNYSCDFILNTSQTGAGITGTVSGFPVLVRLTTGNFNFDQAETDGSDIRFTKPDNTILPYEIERWDTVAGLAEVWVKLDTVYGNDSTQSITMFWGNPDAAIAASSETVFDTANKFISVWHMNEDPSAGIASIKDRTVNAHNATPYGTMSATNSIGGAIGKAINFDGIDDYINAGNVQVPANYSIGLWVLLDTIGNYQRFILKDSCYTLWYDKDSVSVRMEHMGTTTPWRGLLQDGGTRVPMTTGIWYYLTGTFDGNAIRLYENGTEVAMSNLITVIPGTNSKPLTIGQSFNHSFVNGIMDEIRIEGTARSADWIRLCYMNQRIDDKLVRYK